MARVKAEVYKEVRLPDTITGCRILLRQYIDEVDRLRAQAARPVEAGPGDTGVPTVPDPMLRVPRVEP